MTKSNKSSHVVHLIPSLEVGGMERLVADLALGRTAGKTSILCLNMLGTLGEQIEKDIPIKVLNIPSNLILATIAVYKALKQLSPDIIHCHNLQAHFFGGLCAKFLPKTQVVLTKHGQHVPTSGLTSVINKYTLQKSKIIGVSADITQIMQSSVPKNKFPIEYIPNGISLTAYNAFTSKDEAKLALQVSPSTFCIGIVARLSPPKDHILLINAIAALSKTYPDIQLIIIGCGPLKSMIEDYIVSNKYEHVVTMLGERNDIANILNALDVFALTSSSEGIPMTILEAMAASLPVIATDVGGIPQVVINNKTGILVQNKDEQGLIDALTLLIEKPTLRDRFGKEGNILLKSNYSINQIVEKYENAYKSLIL